MTPLRQGATRGTAPIDRAPERRALSFLSRGPLERWKGRWRYGLARIGDDVVDRLIASGLAVRDGNRLTRVNPALEALKQKPLIALDTVINTLEPSP